MPETAGGYKGYTLKRRPQKYPRTRQQSLFAKAAKLCGIKKGISKAEFMERMKHCVPKAYEKLRHGTNQNPSNE